MCCYDEVVVEYCKVRFFTYATLGVSVFFAVERWLSVCPSVICLSLAGIVSKPINLS